MEREVPEKIERTLENKGGVESLMEKIDEKEIERKSEVHKSLSNPLRLKILALLSEQDLCVCLLKEMLEIEDSKLSYHLSILKDVDLIEGERDASFVIYRITDKGKRYAP